MSIHFILGYRSRFDQQNKTFSGGGRDLAADLFGDFTYSYFDEPWPADKEHIILAGPGAWRARGLDERHVGVVYKEGTQFYVPSYHPQDASDVRDVESELYADDGEDSNFDDTSTKDAATTNRANYRAWLKLHAEKLLRRQWQSDYFEQHNIPLSAIAPPESTYLYLDIETHPKTDTLQCLSVAFDKGPIFAQTIYDYRGVLQPGAIQSMRWLVRAMRRYKVVVHNALFDLPFLAMMHGIPWGHAAEDTMLMWHRLFPELDKSLAHLIQYFTNEPYHKDSAGTFHPYNTHQQQQLLNYNARDVFTLRLIHRGLRARHTASMEQVNSSILDYAFAGLRGFHLDYQCRAEHQNALAKKLKQLIRIIQILVGDRNFNPNSGQQIGAWLFGPAPTGLNYKVYDKTDSGAPKTDATSIYKALADHEDNAALVVLLEIKEVAKQQSMLEFEPFTQPHSR